LANKRQPILIVRTAYLSTQKEDWGDLLEEAMTAASPRIFAELGLTLDLSGLWYDQENQLFIIDPDGIVLLGGIVRTEIDSAHLNLNAGVVASITVTHAGWELKRVDIECRDQAFLEAIDVLVGEITQVGTGTSDSSLSVVTKNTSSDVPLEVATMLQRRRRAGPPPTPEKRQIEIVTGWDTQMGKLTLASYVRKNGVSKSTFRRWRRKLTSEGKIPKD
jgi:hypothetical protein